MNFILRHKVKEYQLFNLPDTFRYDVEDDGVPCPFLKLRLFFLCALQSDHAVHEPEHRTQTDNGDYRHGKIVKCYHFAVTPLLHQVFCHAYQPHGMIYIVDHTAAAACGKHKVAKEFRRFDGNHDTGNAPKDIHVHTNVHHHTDTTIACIKRMTR